MLVKLQYNPTEINGAATKAAANNFQPIAQDDVK